MKLDVDRPLHPGSTLSSPYLLFQDHRMPTGRRASEDGQAVRVEVNRTFVLGWIISLFWPGSAMLWLTIRS